MNKKINEIKKNKDKLITEKSTLINGNEEELHSRQNKIHELNKLNESLGFKTTHSDENSKKVQKLKGISDDELAERMSELRSPDVEASHSDANGLLLRFMRENGYGKTADAFEALDNWYA